MNSAVRIWDEISTDTRVDLSADAWQEMVRHRALDRGATPPPQRPRALVVGAIVLAVLLHGLLVLWLRELMQKQVGDDTDRIEVSLIDAPPPEPALPIPTPLPRIAIPSLPQPAVVIARRKPPAAPVSAAANTEAEPAVQFHAYNPDGSLNVPKDLAEQLDAMPSKPDFIPESTAPSPIMLRHRPLKIRPNHFAKDWVHPQNETLLGDVTSTVADFVDENLTAKKEFTTPWGSKIKCQVSFLLIMAGGGCGWGYPPPPGGRPTEHWKPATVLDEE